MAVDPAVFSYWWALWCEKWNRKPSPAFVREFHAGVGHLDSDAFGAAARALWQGDGYFPAVADVLERAAPAADPGTHRADAAKAFDAVTALAVPTPHGCIWRRTDIETTLGPLVLQAFDVAGGQNRWRTMTEQDEHWARKVFVDAYTDLALARDRAGIAERLTALSDAQRGKLGPQIRSRRLEHIGTVVDGMPMLPAGTSHGQYGERGSDGKD